MLDGNSRSDEELRKKLASYVFEPEETLQEFYDLCLGEGEFYHNGFHYSIYWSNNSLKNGFDICFQDLNNPAVAYLNGNEEQIPFETFATRAELISQFKLKNDGRTILEYYCDYFKKPRMLLPPVPTDYPDV